MLERLPEVLERPKSEVYLAAARLTPELAGVLEQGIPYTIQQAAPLLTLLEENLGGLFTQLHGKPLSELMTPADEKTMSHINAAMAHVAELVQALEDGRIDQQQFEHVTETIRQLKLSVLAGATHIGTP